MKELKDMTCDEIFSERFSKNQELDLMNEIERRMRLLESNAAVIAELKALKEWLTKEARNYADGSETGYVAIDADDVYSELNHRISALSKQEGKV